MSQRIRMVSFFTKIVGQLFLMASQLFMTPIPLLYRMLFLFGGTNSRHLRPKGCIRRRWLPTYSSRRFIIWLLFLAVASTNLSSSYKVSITRRLFFRYFYFDFYCLLWPEGVRHSLRSNSFKSVAYYCTL